MAAKIDINADMGESYGRWTLGHDADLMPFLSSANIACGYPGGDPHVMRTTVRLAKEHGVAIGAHVSFPDLIGFGRRRMDVSPQELKDYRSEEHTSELQSRSDLVCRLLLEKKKKNTRQCFSHK